MRMSVKCKSSVFPAPSPVKSHPRVQFPLSVNRRTSVQFTSKSPPPPPCRTSVQFTSKSPPPPCRTSVQFTSKSPPSSMSH